MMGELWTLMPGLTARRLMLTGSRSSSRRRLLLMRRVISAALGGWPGIKEPVPAPVVLATAAVLLPLLLALPWFANGSGVPLPELFDVVVAGTINGFWP
jgi:hypothetical protein